MQVPSALRCASSKSEPTRTKGCTISVRTISSGTCQETDPAEGVRVTLRVVSVSRPASWETSPTEESVICPAKRQLRYPKSS